MRKKFKLALYLTTFTALFVCVFTVCSDKPLKDKKMPVDYVNPYMGNISHLLVPTYPTVHLPNSMLRVYPERSDYTTDQLKGLPVAITSHRGSSAFNISPIQGSAESLVPVKMYSYDKEKIVPYEYYVYLDDEQVDVHYAPSHRSGIYSLNFKKSGNNYIVINVGDGVLHADGNSVSGYQVIDGTPTKIYLYLETREIPVAVGAITDGEVSFDKKTVEGQNQALVLDFGANEKNIKLRYGISFIDAEQAKKNLQGEIEAYNVEKTARTGRELWNKTLSKILIEGGSCDDKVVFYTSLYRTYERMINVSEGGRYYSPFDNTVHDDNGVPFYTDDWIWDTYRATHPLRILIDTDIENDMITSYLRMAEQSEEGWVPTFPEITGDSHRMNGNHAVAVVWDAYVKGLRGYDLERAYKLCRATMLEKSWLPWVRVAQNEFDRTFFEKGYFPALRPDQAEYIKDVHHWEKRQPVAVQMGACYDFWCLAQIAKELGNTNDYNYFLKCSYNYRTVYNAETAFFHPKDDKGDFIMPFDYRYSGGIGAREYYDENNAYVFRWDVPHNPADLIKLMGGVDKFIGNLDQTFREPLGKSKYEFYAQLPDHTGNVGQFSLANEPSLHIPYLYNYAGQPWKTQKRIRELLHTWFRNDLMGVCGDEDGGGMSAFVVFSQMGFYPVTPGSPTYNIGSPVFSKVKMRLSNGKTFEIEAKNASAENKYIQSATLNGKNWDKPWFSHTDIINGAKLVLVMGSEANYNWGADLKNVPPSAEKID